MDKKEERLQWRRVPGSPSLWTIGPSPAQEWDSDPVRVFSRFGVRFAHMLRALLARFSGLRRNRRSVG